MLFSGVVRDLWQDVLAEYTGLQARINSKQPVLVGLAL
jgi:hypothetical protein